MMHAHRVCVRVFCSFPSPGSRSAQRCRRVAKAPRRSTALLAGVKANARRPTARPETKPPSRLPVQRQRRATSASASACGAAASAAPLPPFCRPANRSIFRSKCRAQLLG